MKKEFGATKNGEKASCYVLKNSKGMEAVVSDFGASLLKLYVPDKDGKTQDVVLGYETLEDYENGGDSLGATVGRVANRIGMAEFELNGKKYELTKNDNGKNTLHGGIDFYNKRMWDVKEEDDTHVVFALVSPDGDQGFPGEVKIEVSYTITEENELKIHYQGICDEPTIANMTNHSYFNLNGDTSGSVRNHLLKVNSKSYIPINKNLIPTGEITPTKDSPFDFSEFKEVETALNSSDIQISLAKGIDHMFVLNHNGDDLVLASSLIGEKTGINLKCYTTQKGVHIYSANYVDVPLTESKHSKAYKENSGICFETQGFPDAVNQDIFPTTVIKANEKYKQTTKFVFN